MERSAYLLEKYYSVDDDIKGNFKKLSAHVFPKGSIEYADNKLLLMRCQLFKEVYKFIADDFHEVMAIYVQNADLAGQFFALTTYGLSCRDNKNITEATRVLNKAYKISYQLNDYNLMLWGLINFICLDDSLNSVTKIQKVFGGVEKYLKHATHNKIIGAYHHNYGYMLFLSGHIEEVLEHYYLSLEAYSKFYKNKQTSNILAVRYGIAEIKLSLKDYNEAIELYQELYEEAKNIEDDGLVYKCLEGLVQVYEILHDYENAFKYSQLLNQKISSFKNFNSKLNSEKLCEYLSTELDESKEKMVFSNLELKKKTLELDKNITQLSLISKIGKKITLARNETDLFNLMIDTICGQIEYDYMGLFIVDSHTKNIRTRYIANRNDVLAVDKQITLDSQYKFASYCVQHNVDILIDDLQTQAYDYIQKLAVDNEGGSRIYCRLLSGNELIGILTLQSKNTNQYDTTIFETIKSISSYVAIALTNVNINKLLEERTKTLKVLSYCDSLTGLRNRRSFIEYSDFLKETPSSYSSIALIIADMNHLKLINDHLGHLQGDKFLLEISNVLRQASSNYATKNYKIYRLSGDEFGVFVLNTSEQEVRNYIVTIKTLCTEREYSPYPLSLAVGYVYADTFNSSQMFSNAEKNMYRDKQEYYQNSSIERRHLQ